MISEKYIYKKKPEKAIKRMNIEFDRKKNQGGYNLIKKNPK